MLKAISWKFQTLTTRFLKRVLHRLLMGRLTFEESIIRDWCLINVELHHLSFTKDFKKLGWSFTDSFYEGKDNSITVYYPTQEYLCGMRDFIISQIKRDKDWIQKQSDKLKGDVRLAIAELDGLKRLDTYSSHELSLVFKRFIKSNREIWPRFLCLLMFPIQMEGRNDYQKDVKLSIKARIETDKFGPVADTFGRAIAKEVLKRAKISEEFAKFVSCKEVLDYLDSKKLPQLSVLKQRRKYFIVTNDGILLDKLDTYLAKKKYLLKTLETKSEIKGKSAFLGKVRGTVKIILNKEEFSKLNEGEILVTGMTTPDYLPIMKKAAAFVTDEGGVTCHAAIVARELKKPCIIGTKTATKTLKDGDFVEVDADKGTVRILKN